MITQLLLLVMKVIFGGLTLLFLAEYDALLLLLLLQLLKKVNTRIIFCQDGGKS